MIRPQRTTAWSWTERTTWPRHLAIEESSPAARPLAPHIWDVEHGQGSRALGGALDHGRSARNLTDCTQLVRGADGAADRGGSFAKNFDRSSAMPEVAACTEAVTARSQAS